MEFLIVAALFIVGMMVLIALSNVDKTGCVGDAGKCIYDQFKGIKVNGLTINNSHDLLVLIVVILISLALAYLIVRLVKGNKSHKGSEVYRMNTEKLPHWIDDSGEASAIMALFMALPLLFIAWIVFGAIIEKLSGKVTKDEPLEKGVFSRGNNVSQGYFRKSKNW